MIAASDSGGYMPRISEIIPLVNAKQKREIIFEPPLDDTNWPKPDIPDIDETTALLIQARGLLKRGWCRNASARNGLGIPVSPYSKWATAWCASGALNAAAGLSCQVQTRARNRLADAMGGFIAFFNDAQKTVEPILAAYDQAIAKERAASENRAAISAAIHRMQTTLDKTAETVAAYEQGITPQLHRSL
jgi:hypothetical protein